MQQDTYQEAMSNVMATPESVQGIILVALIMAASMLSAFGAVFSFLFTMTFFRVPEKHRRMSLGQVWFIMAPLFGVFWLYVTVKALAESFRFHFEQVARDDATRPVPPGDFGLQIGTLMVGAAGLTHLAGLLVYTKSSLAMGIGIGSLAGCTLVLSVWYFAQVFRVRKLIPDPEQEIVPESYL